MSAQPLPQGEAPGFDVRFDAATGVLHLRLTGFWTMMTVVAFTAKLLTTATSLRIRHRSFDVLSDSTAFPVQSAAVAAAFTRIMERGTKMNDGRTAIIVGSMSNKKQAERTLQGAKVRVFLDRAEALAWLGLNDGGRG